MTSRIFIYKIGKTAKKRLNGIWFRTLSLFWALIIAYSGFLCLRLLAVDYCAETGAGINGFAALLLIILAAKDIICGSLWVRVAILLCSGGISFFRGLSAFFVLKLAVFTAKLPAAICLGAGTVLLLRWLNGAGDELLLAFVLVLLLLAICFFLAYLYFISGLFAAPLLIARGEKTMGAIRRSCLLMRRQRLRVFAGILRFLPLLPFFALTFPQLAMRFVLIAEALTGEDGEEGFRLSGLTA